MVGRLEKVKLQKVWAHEAKNFTTWMENNIGILSEHIGLNLTVLEREKSAGAFSADIFAEGPNGDTVVIENQLGKTDHDHLGKLITYLSNLEAKTAIWISSHPRPEHITAVNWLNEVSPPDTSFYLVKVEAFKIGDSEPAPLFTALCEPSQEAKQIGEQKHHLAERQLQRLEFWKQLLDKAKIKTNIHSNVSPGKDNWVSAGAGKSGLGWSYSVLMDKGFVELSIDLGPDKKEETDKIYEKFLADRERIEKEFGEPLVWDQIEGRRVCRIKSFSSAGGLKDESTWEKLQDDMVDRMVRFSKALKPVLAKVK